ncbi:MAG: efflux RND transporter periplasmic adaptor subunit [Gammaproteobacteria bacterium]|nr:efflux RND transporter periplasmic adaptor subunit [Gammaproteobacteria bacterium]MDP2139782.1 efflux RND transporter periplasmic adaptor subunit [Gammaproteobacteria bacterium]MDP2346401.1 efflux RND transporter periplasmic adaptor subunit [Gammaproteobacteria bacterium]
MKSPQDATAESQNSPLINPRRRQKRSSRWIMAALVVLAIYGWYYYQSRGDGEEQNQPLLVTVEIGNIENTISSAGSLKPSVYVDVGAQVSGQLEKIHVEVGDKVEANQQLAEIDARTQESRVAASRSALEALEAQIGSRQASLDLARSNAERQQRLMKANATSQQDYDTAMSNLAGAESNLTQLQKQIAQSRSTLSSEETQLEFTRIYAPIAGTVVSIAMNEGRTLNASQQAPTIMRIADLSTMTVETGISEADIGNLKIGMDIYFTTLSGGSRRWFGKLRQILPTPVIENNVVLYTGLFDVDNSDGSLLPEMTAQVFFITASARDVLTVPVGALTFGEPGARPGATSGAAPTNRPAAGTSGANPGAPNRRPATLMGDTPARRPATVTVVAADGTQQQREVVIGVTSRVSAEVISGLQAGEQVVAGIMQSAASANQSRQGFSPVGGFGGAFR